MTLSFEAHDEELNIWTITWCLSVARLFVCIGDCGITPFAGGTPIRPHINVCNIENIVLQTLKTGNWRITCRNAAKRKRWLYAEILNGISAYQEPQKKQVVVIRSRLSQIELFLLSKLRCYAMIKVIEHGNHSCRNKSSNYVEKGNVQHVLSFRDTNQR